METVPGLPLFSLHGSAPPASTLCRSALFALAALLALPAGLTAQQPASTSSALVGVVREAETLRPLADVAVTLREMGAQALTDAEGRFAFRELAGGRHYRVSARHLSYGSVTRDVEVPWRATVQVEITLSVEPIEVELIRVVAVRDRALEVRGFYERRAWGERAGLGTFLDREEIERRGTNRLSSLLQQLPSVGLIRYCSPHCQSLPRIGSAFRLVSMTGGGVTAVPCPAHVYLNGVPARLFRFQNQGVMPIGDVGEPAFLQVLSGIDDLVLVGEVAAVEVYRRASEMPGEFIGSDSRCGVVAIWTR